MPDTNRYEISFRPPTYLGVPESILSKIKGVLRQLYALEIYANEGLDKIPDKLLKEGISKANRDLIGRHDLILMGGEFLPDYMENEIEIARITLNNLTLDTWSVRARKDGERIKYRVVDEEELMYSCTPEESREPLTFGDLIDLIDKSYDISNGLRIPTNPFRDFNLHLLENSQDEVDFVTVFSIFYPEVKEWYEEEAREYLEYIRNKYH